MIAACLKWTSPPGASDGDERFAGVSAADQAALEVALALAEQMGDTVTAVTVGPPGGERTLREALACGAASAVRVDVPAGSPSTDVARELASVVAGASIVVCGDYSLDRGSGSVPAFVAHRLGAAQALGLLAVSRGDGHLDAMRRLDGGRREVLRVPLPCVVSVEGSVAGLRRASLRASLASASAPIDVCPPTSTVVHTTPAAIVTPFRPRARVMPPPAGEGVLDRVRSLTDAGTAPARGETVILEPRAAAEHIVAALRIWGYLD